MCMTLVYAGHITTGKSSNYCRGYWRRSGYISRSTNIWMKQQLPPLALYKENVKTLFTFSQCIMWSLQQPRPITAKQRNDSGSPDPAVNIEDALLKRKALSLTLKIERLTFSLHLWSYSFDHYPQHRTTGEGGNMNHSIVSKKGE